MKPRLSDIARNLSVSSATVSLALSGKGKGRISTETMDRIEAEAARIGYAPNQMGKALRTGRSQVIGLVLPDFANPLFPRMARAIITAAEAKGYGVLVADSLSDTTTQERAVQQLVNLGADGLVVIPRKGSKIAKSSIPIVVIDAATSPLNVVSADHAGGGEIAVTHLREHGHTDILYLGDTQSSLVQRTRIKGMMRAGGPGGRTLWMEDAPDIAAAVRDGVTAIATTSDRIALQVMLDLAAAGLRVPQDVSITGFDNLDFGEIVSPSLTTVATSDTIIGTGAIDALDAQINGADPITEHTVPMHLISRETVARLTSGGETT
ncbi:LacI family DNA-binding transcriptional regulator [Litoreibacter arenae]|uniref:Putative transcriptional regulator protein, LacI family n=1 Tax=Litoreibacter arenae DSM 19593 TaxID=1123360 RepID=S9RMR7_9RHOB|nr:LacI family DNA-binding transcriptional regulator [Litoreibacter arenae]EPX79405.1 putative transcriptional regulator protein, LacI family [Litoreibacter arenae DSM 19593]